MIVDVSEIKDFRHCKRKWQLASRNSFHMRPIVTPSAFKMGTVFHECLHKLYTGKEPDEVYEYLAEEMQTSDPKELVVLKSMIMGYVKEVLPYDGHYMVLDIEHHFKFKPLDMLDDRGKALLQETIADNTRYLIDLEIAGSIDMIVLDVDTNEVWGFEHKTAKNFRNDSYLWMDEQPRVYYSALINWVAEYNKREHDRWAALENPALTPEPVPVKLGGVFINEVRKLVRTFDYKRSPLRYSPDDIRNFMLSFITSCAECHKYVDKPELPRIPQPDLMSCSTCQFNTVCQTYQYTNLVKGDVLKEFRLEFEERKEDHLTEKIEVDKTVTLMSAT